MARNIEEIESFLTIPIPESDDLILESSRRITGPGLLWSRPGAILDVCIKNFDKKTVVEVWTVEIKRILQAIGWNESQIIFRIFDTGVNLAISAPIDLLYSAVFVNETSWHLTTCKLLYKTPESFEKLISDLEKVISLEKNPLLIELQKKATEKDIDILWDDDFVSLGHGKGSQKWSVNNIPNSIEIEWNKLFNVPVVLITGTNGKSTSVRLSAAIAKAAGLMAGSTSTDFIKLGDDILDYGDYSGPGGARMLLRDKRLEIAFLEVARGGILRRGLPLTQASAALVTNVAADHLGEYGINSVEHLADAKFAVAGTLSKSGILVLNADDDLVVQNGLKNNNIIYWFSLCADNPLILDAKIKNKPCCWYSENIVHYFNGQKVSLKISVNDIPITMGGTARFNIQNAMGVICLAKAVDMPDKAIKSGLANFKSTPEDNPGRCNEFVINGARIFVDFAHNPHSIDAIADMLKNIPAKNKFLMISHAGDRSDKDIIDLTTGALKFAPDTVVTAELVDYLRGRKIGDIPKIIKDECIRKGMNNSSIHYYASPSEGAKFIIDNIKKGDLALLLALSERDKIFDMLKQQ